MENVILVLLSLLGLVYLRAFLANQPVRLPVVPGTGFGLGDGLLAALLVCFFTWMAVESFGRKVTLTIPGIIVGSAIYISIVLLILGVMVSRHRNPIRLFGLRWPEWRRALPAAFLALIAAYPLIILTQVAVQHLLGPEAKPQDIILFLISSQSWADRLALIAMAAVIAPVTEEVVFRGYIYGVLRQHFGLWPALIVTSLIFAAIHAHIPAIAGLFVFAVFLTLVYEKTGSLWASMILHATFNSITLAFAILWPDVIQ